MSVSNNKFELNVLIRQKTRLKLSLVFNNKYQYKYPSFSLFIEDVLLKGLNVIGGYHMNPPLINTTTDNNRKYMSM